MPKTIIQAYIQRENSIEVESVALFVIEHRFNPPHNYLVSALGRAFEEWYLNDKAARDYVDDNGVNWGDALEIPDSYLKKHEIEAFYPLVTGNGKKMIHEIEFDSFLVVNHDDALFDLGAADDILDGKQPEPDFKADDWKELGASEEFH